jgi:hypothetical protein
MGWWTVHPRAANNGWALTDATVDGLGNFVEQDLGNPAIWYVSSNPNLSSDFDVYCPGYQTTFVYADFLPANTTDIYVDMAYIGSWPQTY